MDDRSTPPPPAPARHAFVDALRGFALFGVLAANLWIFSGIVYMPEEQRAALAASPLDRAASFLELFLVENKFMGLFSMLFGVSFWLFLSRARARGAPAVRLFYRRIGWLFVIGAVHGWLFWAFDILRFYALWAVLLPLFLSWRPRRLLVAALAAGTVVPALVAGARAFWPAPSGGAEIDAATLAAFSTGGLREVLAANWRYDWYLTKSVGQISYQVAVFGRLLLGLCLARTFDFGDLGAHRPLLRRVLAVGAIVGVAGNLVFAAEWLGGTAGRPVLAALRRLLVEGGHLGLTLAYAAGLALLFLRPAGRRALSVLAPLGQMALTWYLFQTATGLALFYGFAGGLMGRVPPALLAAGCVAQYAGQVWIARAWMRRFRFGPAEWAWRSLTYGAWQPMRRTRLLEEPNPPRGDNG
jgi:uncharacterized protein